MLELSCQSSSEKQIFGSCCELSLLNLAKNDQKRCIFCKSRSIPAGTQAD